MLAGSKLVRSWSPTSFEPDSVMEFGFEPVCDQLRTSSEPASIMEFGFYQAPYFKAYFRVCATFELKADFFHMTND